ncbi:spindle pole body duplication -related protein [Moniliophthora roreri MCA 2997]|uniref:Spindle pole body duplication-related protein n=2 Tax=Moniliophthora roreri TaxID=221103 RepID=V2XKK5_MONRO|nr:spindle pole body duplication -related protein [Moniliophthora roreri MCA 2997]
MFGFRPSRSSPPAKRTPIAEPVSIQSADLSHSSQVTAPELTGLSHEDVELLDAIIERAGTTATTFLTVFKAYNDVLQERGMNPKEVFYYGKLLKLGTLRGGSWSDKWEMIKQQNGYGSHGGPKRPQYGKTSIPVTQKPSHASTFATQGLTDDLFSSVSHAEEDTERLPSESGADAESEFPAQRLSSPFNPHRLSPNPSDLTNNTLGLEIEDYPLLSAPSHRPGYRPSQKSRWEYESSSTPFAETSTPPSYRAAVRATAIPKPAPLDSISSIGTDRHSAPKQLLPIIPKGRERSNSAINEEDAWKKIKMAQDEKEADRFRDDRLLERCWDIWKQGFTWIMTTNSQIGEARDNLVVRIHFQRWRQRAVVHRELYSRVAAVANARCLKAAFKVWKQRMMERVKEKQQAAWRQDMRSKMAIVRKRHNEGVKRDFFLRWRQAYQLRAAEQHYQERLVVRCYLRWKETLHGIYHLEANADQAYYETFVARFWDHWRRRTELRVPEKVVENRVAFRIKSEALGVWKKHWNDVRAADFIYRFNLAKKVIRSWKATRDRMTNLEHRANKHVARQDDILLRAVMRVWKAHERGKLLEKVKAFRLIRSAWVVWKMQLRSQRRLEDVALRFSQRLNSSASKLAMQRWREVHASHQNAWLFAGQYYANQLMQRTILEWRLRLFKQLKMQKKARVIERYFILRRYWSVIKQKYQEKVRSAKLQQLERNKMQIYFELWLNRTKKQKHLREAERIIQDRVRKRILNDALQYWTLRVVEIKDRELRVAQEVAHHTKETLLTTAFNKWKRVYARHEEELSLMQSYQDIKREEKFKRIFYRWLAAARVARHRRLALQEREEERRIATLMIFWDKWRERYKDARLQPLEYEFVISNAERLKYRAFVTWQAKTKSLPAIKFHASHVKAKYWKIWMDQLPRALQAKKAREYDKLSTLKRCFEKWVQVHRTKLSLKAVARARYFPVASTKPTISRPITTVRPFPAPSTTSLVRTGFPRRALRVEESEEDEESEAAGQRQPPVRYSRPLSARTGLLYLPKARTDPSPTRTLLSNQRTRESSPARSIKSTDPVPWYARDRSPTRLPPPPSSVADTEGRSTLWQELREVQRKSYTPSEYSKREPG